MQKPRLTKYRKKSSLLLVVVECKCGLCGEEEDVIPRSKLSKVQANNFSVLTLHAITVDRILTHFNTYNNRKT